MAADELDYEAFEQQFEEDTGVKKDQKRKVAFKRPSRKVMIGIGIVGAIIVIAFITQVFANIDYSQGGYAILQPNEINTNPTSNPQNYNNPLTKPLDIGYFIDGDITYSPDNHLVSFTYEPKGGENLLVIERMIYNDGIPAPETAIRITDFSDTKTVTLPAYQWSKGVPLRFTLTANSKEFVSTYVIKAYTSSNGNPTLVINEQKI